MTGAAEIIRQFRQAAGGPPRLYISGGPTESGLLRDTFAADPDLAEGITFVGIWLPGINRTDWTAFHPASRAESTFLGPDHRAAWEAGRLQVLPLHYSSACEWIARTPLDGAFLPVSAPDAQGSVSLGLATDLAPALVKRTDVPLVALIRPGMPAPPSAPKVPLARFDHVLEDPSPLITIADPPLTDDAAAIAAHVATLLADGFTVQSGIGSVQQIAMAALSHHRHMRVHTGMLTDAVLAPLRSGAISASPGTVLTGTAVGTQALYDACARDPRFNFQPVTVTHSVSVIAAIPRFAAINGGIEVDLMGQVNSEYAGGRQVASTGGLGNFVRGAQLSAGGRSIIALPSTAKGGTVSRIVAQLDAPAVTLTRADAGYVVTEHGIADLTCTSIEERGERLIAVAAPQFRNGLMDAWLSARRR